ncbi:hypothetical protein [Kutzneria buriramensis]|uniref:hypothetical protein n=1 Tax=Kutzneria buriramensis TaxID=1045776 RepID=UPI0011C13378|nr:hypothetical protein [Kutzneria buriramensis]
MAAVAAAFGLVTSSVAMAVSIVPFDAGTSTCTADTSKCHLFHFKLDGHSHTISITTFNDPCSSWNTANSYKVTRKNSANFWLDPNKDKYFFVNFDWHAGNDMKNDMVTYPCGGGAVDYAFPNNQNRCWYLMTLKTTGQNCNWG